MGGRGKRKNDFHDEKKGGKWIGDKEKLWHPTILIEKDQNSIRKQK